MATAAGVGEIHEITVYGTQELQQVMNVLHVRVDAATDNMELNVLKAIIDCYIEILMPQSGSNWQLNGVRAKQVAPILGPIYEYIPETTEGMQGEAAGDTLPSHCSICFNIHTTRGGKSGRGRLFIPGIPEGATSGSTIPISNIYWTALLAFAACLAGKLIHVNEPLGSDFVSLGVVSRKLGNAKPPYLVSQFAPATRLTPRRLVGSSNSRKIGRGV